MPRGLSNNFKRAAFSQETDECFICMVTISHPTFTDDIRVVDDPTMTLPIAGVRGLVSRGLEYVFLPFTFALPSQNDSETAKAQITMDNVGLDTIAQIRKAGSAVSVKIELVISSDFDQVEFACDKFQLKNVNYDALTITGDLSLEYFDLEPYPSLTFTPSIAPGLF